ncbi:MAG: hypothetical protein JNK93_04845 [Planctomycetia bacterium]|nr:hypothetical protein [Planctomycetia bacterium]
MTGTVSDSPFGLAARLRRAVACALVGLLALAPLLALSTGKSPLARAGFPIAPANETEHESEETEATLSLRANVRWSPPGRPSFVRPLPFPHPTCLSDSPLRRDTSPLSPTDGPRLRC